MSTAREADRSGNRYERSYVEYIHFAGGLVTVKAVNLNYYALILLDTGEEF